MWRRSRGSQSRPAGSDDRRVRFAPAEEEEEANQNQNHQHQLSASLSSINVPVHATFSPVPLRRRLSLSSLIPGIRQQRNKRGRTSSSSNTTTNSDFHLAADEIERILRDEITSSTNTAASQIMTEEDKHDHGYDGGYHDDDISHDESSVPAPSSSSTSSPRRRRISLSSLSIRRLIRSSTETATATTGTNNNTATTTTSLFQQRESYQPQTTSTAEDADGDGDAATDALLPPPQASSDEFTLTEQDVNAYELFDSAGADEARLRLQERNRRRQQERTESSSNNSTTTNRFASHLFPLDHHHQGGSTTSSRNNTDGVIYDLKKYGACIPFFTPILVLLTTIFCVLVVLRLLVSLLTVAVGWLVVIVLTGRLLHQLRHRPLHLGRLVHARPLLAWAFLGGLLGMASVCGSRVISLMGSLVLTLTRTYSYYYYHAVTTMARRRTSGAEKAEEDYNHHEPNGYCYDYEHNGNDPNHFLSTLIRQDEWSSDESSSLQAPYSQQIEQSMLGSFLSLFLVLPSSFSCVFSMRQDLVLIWGLLEGIFYGVQVGLLWLCLLGHAAKPSPLSQWMYHHLWRFAQRQYRTMRQRQRQRRQHNLRLQQRQQLVLRWRSEGIHNNNTTTTTTTTSTVSSTPTDDHRKQCMICLEDILEEQYDDGENGHDDDDDTARPAVSSLYQRHYLLCRHSFHSCCIQEWLEIKASCPICRIPLNDNDNEDNADANADDDGRQATATGRSPTTTSATRTTPSTGTTNPAAAAGAIPIN
jgi:hypothetical protein